MRALIIAILVLSASLAAPAYSQAASTSPQLYGLSFVELTGRPGHQGLFPLQGAPPPGTQATIQAIVTGPVASCTLNLFAQSGALLASVPLARQTLSAPNSPEFYGTVTVPTVPFVSSIQALDTSGNTFTLPTGSPPPIVVPQTLQIHLQPLIATLYPRTPAAFLLILSNFGPADTFNVTASAMPTSSLTLSENALYLASHAAKAITVTTIVPDNADPLEDYHLSLSAVGSGTAAAASASLAVELQTATGITLKIHPLGACHRDDTHFGCNDRPDLCADQKDIAQDQADIRADSSDINNDRRDVRGDKKRVNEDRTDIRADKKDLENDRADLRADQRDLAEDQADFRLKIRSDEFDKGRGLAIVIEATPSFDPKTLDPTSIFLAGDVAPIHLAFRDKGCDGDKDDGRPNDLIATFDRTQLKAAIHAQYPTIPVEGVRLFLTAQTTFGIPAVGLLIRGQDR